LAELSTTVHSPATYHAAGDLMRTLRWRQLFGIIGLSRTQIWRLEKSGDFPNRVQLNQNSIGWVESEVKSWLEERKQQRK